MRWMTNTLIQTSFEQATYLVSNFQMIILFMWGLVSHFQSGFHLLKCFIISCGVADELAYKVKSYSLFKTMEIRLFSWLAALHVLFPWKAFVNDQPAVLNTPSGAFSLRGYSMCVSLLKCINKQVFVFVSMCSLMLLVEERYDWPAARPLCSVMRCFFFMKHRRRSVSHWWCDI